MLGEGRLSFIELIFAASVFYRRTALALRINLFLRKFQWLRICIPLNIFPGSWLSRRIYHCDFPQFLKPQLIIDRIPIIIQLLDNVFLLGSLVSLFLLFLLLLFQFFISFPLDRGEDILFLSRHRFLRLFRDEFVHF